MKKCVLAIDAGGTFLKAALFVGGQLLADSTDRQAVDSDKGTAEQVRAAYTALIGREKSFADKAGMIIEKVAVDTPGPFDFETGTPRMEHKYRAIYGVSLIPWIKESAGEVEVRFIHDSHAFIRGVAREIPEYSRIAGVMLGTGLGFAMMTDGQPLLNENGGPLVSIYKTPYRAGIAEDYLSGRGIVRCYNALAPVEAENAKQVGDLAEAGDKIALEVYENLGIMIADVVRPILQEHMTQALVIGGQLAKSFDIFGEPLRRALHGVKSLKYVAAAKNIDDAHLYGAASAI